MGKSDFTEDLDDAAMEWALDALACPMPVVPLGVPAVAP